MLRDSYSENHPNDGIPFTNSFERTPTKVPTKEGDLPPSTLKNANVRTHHGFKPQATSQRCFLSFPKSPLPRHSKHIFGSPCALQRLHSPRGGSAPHRHLGTPRCRRGNADTKPRATELIIQVRYAVCLHMEPGWVPNPNPSGEINVTREATTIWQKDQGLMLKTKPDVSGLFKVMDIASHTSRTSQNSWFTSFKTMPKEGTPNKKTSHPFLSP